MGDTVAGAVCVVVLCTDHQICPALPSDLDVAARGSVDFPGGFGRQGAAAPVKPCLAKVWVLLGHQIDVPGRIVSLSGLLRFRTLVMLPSALKSARLEKNWSVSRT